MIYNKMLSLNTVIKIDKKNHDHYHEADEEELLIIITTEMDRN